MKLVAKLIPLIIFLSICNILITTEFSTLSSIWKCVVILFIIGALNCIFALGNLCIRYKQNIFDVIRIIRPAVAVSFITGSSSVSMPKMYDIAKSYGNGKSEIASYWIPLSFSMFSPSGIPALVVYSFFAAEQGGTPISPVMLIIMFIMTLEMGYATPNIPGGVMATVTLLLTQLGISTDSIGLIMAAGVFVSNYNTAVGSVLRCTELLRAEIRAKQAT